MKILFTLFLFLLVGNTFAQSNYVKGHYITQNGDTVQAFIDDQNWDKNPKFITVKNAVTTTEKRMSVKDIIAFSLSTGDQYETYVVDIDKTPSNLNEIEANAAPEIVNDTIFLRVLVKGNVSLYYLKDENAKQHFYLKKSLDKPEELIFRHEKLLVNEQIIYRRPEIYKGLMNLYFTDCETVKERINNVKYRWSDFIKITNEYNVCASGSGSDYVVKTEKPEVHFGLLGGGSHTYLSFKGEHYEELEESNFEDFSYTYGVSLDVVLPRAHGKFSIRNELMYKTFTAEDTYTKRVFPDRDKNYTVYDTYFDMAHIGLNTMIHYRLYNGLVKPYVQVGVANNFIRFLATSQHRDIHYYDIHKEESVAAIGEAKMYSQSLLAGAGFTVKNFSAEVRAEYGNGISKASSLASSNRSFSLLLGYRIK